MVGSYANSCGWVGCHAPLQFPATRTGPPHSINLVSLAHVACAWVVNVLLLQVVTVTCAATGMVTISPTAFSITAPAFDAMAQGTQARPSITITVAPYFGNDVGAVRVYNVTCSAVAALAGGTVVSGPQPVYAAPRVHGITGTVTPSVFPVWEGQ